MCVLEGRQSNAVSAYLRYLPSSHCPVAHFYLPVVVLSNATGNNGFRECILNTIFNRNQETIVVDSVGPVGRLSDTEVETEEAPAAKAHENFKVFGLKASTGETAHFSTLAWMILCEPAGGRADPMMLQPEPQQKFQPMSQAKRAFFKSLLIVCDEDRPRALGR